MLSSFWTVGQTNLITIPSRPSAISRISLHVFPPDESDVLSRSGIPAVQKVHFGSSCRLRRRACQFNRGEASRDVGD